VGDFTFAEPDVVIGDVIVFPWFPHSMFVPEIRDVIPQIACGAWPIMVSDEGKA
jgi:hypothetical protein